MVSDEGTPVSKQKAKAELVWGKRSSWDGQIQDCYDYILPGRLSGGAQKAAAVTDKLFDMTAPMGAMFWAGNLQKDLFGTAGSRFTYEPGPLLRGRMPAKELIQAEKFYQKISKGVDPFFQTGDFATASSETCLDIGIGTGALMPVPGDKHQPVFFVNIPFEKLACSVDVWGRMHFISWKQEITVEEIYHGFRTHGKFSDEFLEAYSNKPNTTVTFYQDFFKVPGGWQWVAYADKFCDEFIVEVQNRTQQIAVLRYFRAPGEPYGRGPLLMALPTIKTLNKAQELTLRSAAVQLLGIWGYRSGGTFNPDMVNLGPGEFWPMMSTGGQFGADVQRLDPATARLDVARMVVEGMREDVKSVLMDNKIRDDGSTPPSASQVVAMMQQRAEANLGAFGRLSHEGMPVLAPRVTEILYEQGIVKEFMPISELLQTVKVRSPMQQALDARLLENTLNYYDIAAAIAGPDNVDEHIKPDVVLADARKVLDLDEDVAPSDTERAKIRSDKAAARGVEQMAAMALEAAKVQPEQAQGVG